MGLVSLLQLAICGYTDEGQGSPCVDFHGETGTIDIQGSAYGYCSTGCNMVQGVDCPSLGWMPHRRHDELPLACMPHEKQFPAVAVGLLSCPLLIQTVLACWQDGNKDTCKELCLRFYLTMGAAGRGNWSTKKCLQYRENFLGHG